MKWTLPILVLAAASAAAQADPAPTWSRPAPIDREAAGVALVTGGASQPERIAALDFRVGEGADAEVAQLPFASAVHDVEVRRFPDGRYVVLAGGVREDLDIYVFDPVKQVSDRYPATGGRRLPSTFGDGLGSWPLGASDGLLLFAFEREEKVCFRVGMLRRTFAGRDLSLDCAGFRAVVDPETHEVAVHFVDAGGEVMEDITFVHPNAPALAVEDLEAGIVDFGDVQVGQTVERRMAVRNTGGHLLRARPSIDGGFELRDPRAGDTFALEPGGSLVLTIAWSPQRAGAAEGRLRLDSPVQTCCAEVVLRGTASAPVPIVDTAPAVARRLGSTPPADASAGAAESSHPVEIAGLRRPQDATVTCRWRDDRRLWIDLRLADEDRWIRRIAVRSARGGEAPVTSVTADGRAGVELEAHVLDPVEVAAVGVGGLGPWSSIGVVPPALRLHRNWIHVHAPPRGPYLVAEVVLGPDEERPRRVLRTWRGQADPFGLARLETDSLVGEGEERVHLVLIVPRAGGGAVLSEVLEIGPSSPSSRRDRPK